VAYGKALDFYVEGGIQSKSTPIEALV